MSLGRQGPNIQKTKFDLTLSTSVLSLRQASCGVLQLTDLLYTNVQQSPINQRNTATMGFCVQHDNEVYSAVHEHHHVTEVVCLNTRTV